MNKYPRNHSVGLSRVADKIGDIGKVDAKGLLLRINELHAGDLVTTSVTEESLVDTYGIFDIDLSVYRTFYVTLETNCSIRILDLDPGQHAFIVVKPKTFTCTFTGFKKEVLEDTKPYNLTLYHFFSPKLGQMELLEVTRNMYGIKPGEFLSEEFFGGDFLT